MAHRTVPTLCPCRWHHIAIARPSLTLLALSLATARPCTEANTSTLSSPRIPVRRSRFLPLSLPFFFLRQTCMNRTELCSCDGQIRPLHSTRTKSPPSETPPPPRLHPPPLLAELRPLLRREFQISRPPFPPPLQAPRAHRRPLSGHHLRQPTEKT
uniref:Uncharacterized protein n=1 Tax=Setaria viridis TaxID=4556 RepID=A0A4V6D1G3_SETVI|nr:hypothetical protein SEVIR_9G303066v2 [Setaria viridis]